MARGVPEGGVVSTEFHTYTRDEFVEEFVHPDDREAVKEARERRVAYTDSRRDLQSGYWPG
jgi:hypothetical protein